MDYFASEDAPLLSDFHKDLSEIHHFEVADVHKLPPEEFEVAIFPETPLLSFGSDDDDFSEFVQSPTSEVPPTSKTKVTDGEDSSAKSLSQLLTIEYIQHVAIMLLVQSLIPLPFMLPMGINFTKRALKVFLIGSAIGLAGHSIVNLLHAIPSVRPLDPTSFKHLRQHLPQLSAVLPALVTQVKISALGGFVIGAVMAHVLNFFIFGHTICRLFRGLEPQPTAMRHAMDSSKTFRIIQQVVLDLVTGAFMIPAGSAARVWWYGLWGTGATPLAINQWHAALVGVAGTATMHVLLRMRQPSFRVAKTSEKSKPIHKSIQRLQMAEARTQKDLLSF